MSLPEYVTRTILTAELGIATLTQLASTTGTITTDDGTRVDEVCNRVNSRVDKRIQGLSISTNTIPPALKDIAVRIAKTWVHKATWNPRGVPTPSGLVSSEAEALAELEEIAAGLDTVDNRDPARQIAARFTSTDLDVNPSSTNARVTIGRRMSKLP